MQNEWSPERDDTPRWADPAQPSAVDPAPVVTDPGVGSAVGESSSEDVMTEGEDAMTEGEDAMHRSAVDAVDGLLDEVELALSRLDDGTYGRCETCGEPIAERRLAEHPIARTCGTCESASVHPVAVGVASGEGSIEGGSEPSR
jgi:RNA polymerase-binding transcription factor DksA